MAGKIEVTGEIPVSTPLCSLKIPHELAWIELRFPPYEYGDEWSESWQFSESF
jgi:hypothetical protein